MKLLQAQQIAKLILVEASQDAWGAYDITLRSGRDIRLYMLYRTKPDYIPAQIKRLGILAYKTPGLVSYVVT
jgi:hypothetical protein